jgi:hypothetical protein
MPQRSGGIIVEGVTPLTESHQQMAYLPHRQLSR